MSQHTYIKSEPIAFQDDQEDILMSYLNSDYISTSSAPTCWNTSSQVAAVATPPTPSSTPTLTQSPLSTPDIHQDFFHLVSPTSVTSAPSWSHQLPDSPITSDDYHNTQQPAFINSEFPFLISSSNQSHQHPIIAYHGNVLYHHPSSQLPQYPPFFTQEQLQQQPASPPASLCSSSDGEQPKKRRGRKKRDPCANSSTTTPPPLTPVIIAPAAPVLKQLATILPAAALNNEEVGSAITGSSTKAECTNVTPATTLKQEELVDQLSVSLVDSLKAATIAKRQERLIKNRAAALLSRKRKREHLTALEDQKHGLTSENNTLKEKVMQLEKENLELKNKLDLQQGCDNKTAMIFMMIILSIAYLISSTTRLVYSDNNNTFTTTTKVPLANSRNNDTTTTFQLTSSNAFKDDEEKEEKSSHFLFKKRLLCMNNQNHNNLRPSSNSFSSLNRGKFERIVL